MEPMHNGSAPANADGNATSLRAPFVPVIRNRADAFAASNSASVRLKGVGRPQLWALRLDGIRIPHLHFPFSSMIPIPAIRSIGSMEVSEPPNEASEAAAKDPVPPLTIVPLGRIAWPG